MVRLENAESFRHSDKKTLLSKAKEVVEAELNRSSIFHKHQEAMDKLPTFDANEMVLGRVVGRGGFCVVKEINAIRLSGFSSSSSMNNGGGGGDDDHEDLSNHRRQKSASSSSTSSLRWTGKPAFLNRGSSLNTSSGSNEDLTAMNMSELDRARERMARRIWSKRGGKYYCIKQVEPEFIHTDKVTFLKGIIDLALETHYLASLSHPHILCLRGLSRSSPFDDLGYFIIVDQLQETLSKRLNCWMHQKRATSGITGILTGGSRKVRQLLTDRLLVAYDVAEAMNYLHERNIIYRDLKPDNIGFDGEGTLKLFDFGLAKELIEDEQTDDGLYHMTGFTGAVRYMAPEVGLKLPYNLKADVYSWSMLVWYIMALEPPMGLYTPKMLIDRVFNKGYRPVLKEKWPSGLRCLMKQCWSEVIEERPNFREIMVELVAVMVEVDPHTSTFLRDSSDVQPVKNP